MDLTASTGGSWVCFIINDLLLRDAFGHSNKYCSFNALATCSMPLSAFLREGTIHASERARGDGGAPGGDTRRFRANMVPIATVLV